MTKARDLANVGSVAEQGLQFRNKIINGAMRISQRGAVNVTASGGSTYTAADRFSVFNYFGSGQINTAVSTSIVPSGHSSSLALTVGTPVPLNGSTGYLVNVAQTIEGFNIADAYNQTVTLSFWVRSSITGTYSVSFYNASNAGAVIGTRLFVASYTINLANTWEQKFVTVNLSSGTSSGTWDTTNGAGLTVAFGLGAESNRKGNTFLNTWGTFSSVFEYQVASQVNWASTNGATFYITGVQLEKGTQATPFEHVDYSVQLQRCYRYFFTTNNKLGGVNWNPAFAGWSGYTDDAYQFVCTGFNFPVEMRAVPTVTIFSGSGNGYADGFGRGQYGGGLAGVSSDALSSYGVNFVNARAGGGSNNFAVGAIMRGGYTANAEL